MRSTYRDKHHMDPKRKLEEVVHLHAAVQRVVGIASPPSAIGGGQRIPQSLQIRRLTYTCNDNSRESEGEGTNGSHTATRGKSRSAHALRVINPVHPSTFFTVHAHEGLLTEKRDVQAGAPRGDVI